MTIEELEHLVQSAGLNLLSKYAPRFIVSLHVQREHGVRIQCDALEYQPAEFAMLTREQAIKQIAVCKARLERAAKTKQGVLR